MAHSFFRGFVSYIPRNTNHPHLASRRHDFQLAHVMNDQVKEQCQQSSQPPTSLNVAYLMDIHNNLFNIIVCMYRTLQNDHPENIPLTYHR